MTLLPPRGLWCKHKSDGGWRIPRTTFHKRFSQRCRSHSNIYHCKCNKVRWLLATALLIYFRRTVISRYQCTSRRRGTRCMSFKGSGSLYTRLFQSKRVPGACFATGLPTRQSQAKRKSRPDSAGNDANKRVETLIRVLRERGR